MGHGHRDCRDLPPSPSMKSRSSSVSRKTAVSSGNCTRWSRASRDVTPVPVRRLGICRRLSLSSIQSTPIVPAAFPWSDKSPETLFQAVHHLASDYERGTIRAAPLPKLLGVADAGLKRDPRGAFLEKIAAVLRAMDLSNLWAEICTELQWDAGP